MECCFSSVFTAQIDARVFNAAVLPSLLRLDMEERTRQRLGDLAYYQEWVAAWRHDTSKPAVREVQRRTGRPASLQILDMLAYQVGHLRL